MALSNEEAIPVGTTGKFLRGFLQAIGLTKTIVEAVALADPLNPDMVAAVVNATPTAGTKGIATYQVNPPSSEIDCVHVPFTVTGAAPAPFYTAPGGKTIRIHKVTAQNDPFATSSNTISFLLTSVEIFRGYTISERQTKTDGAAAGNLSITNTNSAANVSGTVILELL